MKETGRKIIVTGDFNATAEEIVKYCGRELRLDLSKSPSDGTRHGRNGTKATLDYLMASSELFPTETEIVA